MQHRILDAIIAIETHGWKLIEMPKGESGRMIIPPDWNGEYEWHERIIPIHLSAPDNLLPEYSRGNEIVKILEYLSV